MGKHNQKKGKKKVNGKVGISVTHLACMWEIQTVNALCIQNRIFEENDDGKCNIEQLCSCLAIHVQY